MGPLGIEVLIDASKIQDLQKMREDILKVTGWGKQSNQYEEKLYQTLFQQFAGKKIESVETLKDIMQAKDGILRKIKISEKLAKEKVSEGIFDRIQSCLKGLQKEKCHIDEGR